MLVRIENNTLKKERGQRSKCSTQLPHLSTLGLQIVAEINLQYSTLTQYKWAHVYICLYMYASGYNCQKLLCRKCRDRTKKVTGSISNYWLQLLVKKWILPLLNGLIFININQLFFLLDANHSNIWKYINVYTNIPFPSSSKNS